MKKTTLFALLAILGALAVLVFAAPKFGWSPTSFWTKKPTGLKLELQEFDKKIEPVAERRAKIVKRLEKIESEEQTARKAAADALDKLSADERESLEKDLVRGSLSGEAAKNPSAVVAFARLQEALSLGRQTSALRDGLARYELELVRALSERDRLARRVETSEALGYDPENASVADVDFGILDDLAAQTDESIAEQAKRVALDPLSATASPDELERAFDEIVEGLEIPERVKIDGALDARIDAFVKNEDAANPLTAIAAPKTLAIIASLGFALTAFLILALGVRGIFSMTSRSNVAPAPAVVDPFATTDGSGRPAPQAAVSSSEGAALKLLFFTILGGLFLGPLGAMLGFFLGLIAAGWRALARAVGAIMFVIFALFAALIVYGLVMVAIFI